MTIQQCNYVLQISKAGSFNEAAKQLFVAQSSLSASVKQLEAELGIKIFERSNNGVFLTSEGSEFVRYAEQIVQQNNFILQRYRGMSHCPRLHIVTQHYDFVADVFCHFLREINEPQYHFSLRELQTYDVIHDVELAYSDLGILAIKDRDLDIMKRYLQDKGIHFRAVLHAHPHVYVRSKHPLAKKERLTYEELKAYPYVSYEQGAHSDSLFTEELTEDFCADQRIVISDRATLMNVLLETDGYTIGTGLMPSALNQGKVVGIPVDSQSFYSIGYILREDKKRTPLTNQFIEMLTSFAESI